MFPIAIPQAPTGLAPRLHKPAASGVQRKGCALSCFAAWRTALRSFASQLREPTASKDLCQGSALFPSRHCCAMCGTSSGSPFRPAFAWGMEPAPISQSHPSAACLPSQPSEPCGLRGRRRTRKAVSPFCVVDVQHFRRFCRSAQFEGYLRTK